MRIPRVAIVHDYITQRGGAELAVLAIADAFPGAPIYTSVFQPELTYPAFHDHDVRTTKLQKFIPAGKFRYAAPLFGSSFAHMDLAAFDKVVVSSSGFAHHIKHPNAYIYCHTPPHFIYDLSGYTSSKYLKFATSFAMPILRVPDQYAAKRHRHYVANSMQTKRRIASVYGKQVDVIHPPFGTAHLPRDVSPLPKCNRLLVVARLMPYKRFDVAIRACEHIGIPLTIIGSGPDEARLRSLGGPMTTFMGRLNDEETARAFTEHSAVLMPGLEDFGFAPLDANYSGRPVIALNAGGAMETVKDGINGLLVDGHSTNKWADAIKQALTATWSPLDLRSATKPFQRGAFQNKIRDWVGSSA